jgi:hypothetical protein
MSDLDQWFKIFEKLGEQDRDNKIEGIKVLSKFKPDKILKLPVDPFYNVIIGLWKSPRGIIYIEANARGEFDPRKSRFFSQEIIDAMIKVNDNKPNENLRGLEIE